MRPVNSLVERFIPSAFVFAVVLTFVVAVAALLLTDAGPVRMLLGRLGGVPTTVLQAYLSVFVVASLASLITWGLGLVVGVLLAKEVAAQGRERGLRLHFPMLVAAGYSGYVIWHMGYSASGPLTAGLHFADGGTLTLDIVNSTLLVLILLQFPLYAGIMGIMATTGLITIFSDWVVSVANPTTFGVLAFLSAGIVNFFVPSGGGQFAVQSPVMLDAAARLDVDPSVAIMAIAYGDQWTNMIQPFWALLVLAIASLKMRDILGYTMVTLIASGLVFATVLLLIGAGV
jgi:short subunit fatty acids transporter